MGRGWRLDQYGFSMVDVEPGHHLLARLARQALRLMTALFWDLGEHPATDAGGFSRFLPGFRGEG